MKQDSTETSAQQKTTLPPLVVDLDGTLTPTDTLIESIAQLIKHHPLSILKLPVWLLKGRAIFKDSIASKVALSAQLLPYRTALLDYLLQEKSKGRRLILATAAHHNIADKVAKHLGIFDEVIATDREHNLKGVAKLEAIRRTVGDKFVYAGDSKADLPIWKASYAAILVGASSKLTAEVQKNTPIEKIFPLEYIQMKTWLRALRVHQWVKNFLLFVPMLTAFSSLSADKLVTMLMAFCAFSFAASATYLVNDLLDLESDRAHPRKRHRPLASAQISIPQAMLLAITILTIAVMLALAVSQHFLLMLIIYLVLTSLYSWVLKQYVLIDVLTLSVLYTLRILAGAVAIGVSASSWLLVFSVFIFFSLALVKRCAELVAIGDIGQEEARGRDYQVTDLVVLWPLGIGASLCAVVVFGLFIHAEETQARYASPQLLWLVAIGLTYWLSRLWIKSARGEMHDDPIVFAAQDFGSRVSVLAMIVMTLAAHFLMLDKL